MLRPAPPPAEPGPSGGMRLSPIFVEWLMGLPEGWVTEVPGLSRTEQLKALGNGVVPAQCARAFELLAGVMTGIPVTRAATRAELDELLPTPQTMDGRRRARSPDEIAAARAQGGGCANLREAVFDMGGV